MVFTAFFTDVVQLFLAGRVRMHMRMLLEEFTTDKTERVKANARPVDGRYPEFAREVRRLLGYAGDDGRPFLTSRMVSRKTGINHATVTTMVRGDRPSYQTILRLSHGLGGKLNRLLTLAGYESIERLYEGTDALSQIGPDVDTSAIAGICLSPLVASAGDGSHVHEAGADYETFESLLPGQVRAIRVIGDCMEPFYREGDVVFVREQGNAENGNKVIALVDGESLNCKLYRTNGENYLEPKNGEGRIPASRFRIIGVIVGVFRKED